MQELLEVESNAMSMPTDATWIESEAREKQRRYQRNWEERYSSLLAGRRNWQLMAFALGLMNGGLGYGIWWTETTTALSGQSVSSRMWHARIAYSTKLPTSEQARAENPMGILATELTFNEVQQ